MRCPFGEEVGGPPPMLGRCPRGFPGCACADEVARQWENDADAQTITVLLWWRDHGSPLDDHTV